MAIIGLGYVGLPLGLAFRDAGLEVVGYESNSARLASLRSGQSPLDDVSDSRLSDALAGGLQLCGPDEDGLSQAHAIFICVSTPVTENQEPDLGPVLTAAEQVAGSLRAGQLVVLQSTTWPGTTAGPVRDVLERSGLVAGRDFGLAYAPERVNPGDRRHFGTEIPRVVGGLTPADTRRTAALLRELGGEVVEVSSAETAELAKLHENVFRNVNVALVNQLALLCERMGLDVWEVIGAAATKPFGFMPFWPGPGVGGHCIPVDPYYLAWRARQFGITDRFVELAADINGAMPTHVVNLVANALERRGQALDQARVGIIGVAFKPNVRDARNAPAAEAMAELVRRGAVVRFHDPHVVQVVDTAGHSYDSVPLPELVDESDVVVVMVRHDGVDWNWVYANARLVVDTVNSSAGRRVKPGQTLRLGAGWS
ncbi:MAG: nucleotide sugar dehydrogenase [Candidatus Limnocylindrales bacterium]